MALPDEHIVKWLNKQLKDLTERGLPERFELWHAVEGERGDKLDSYPVDDETEPSELAQEIWAKAEHDAGTHSSPSQKYSVLMFRCDDDSEHEGMHSFILQGRQFRSITGGATEPPTEKGLTAQLMRHSEGSARMMLGIAESTAGRLTRQNEEMSQRIDRMAGQNLDMFEKYQELLDRSAERALEQAKAEAKERRHEELMGMVMAMVPLVASKFLGAGAPSVAGQMAQSSTRDLSVQKLLKGLSVEETTKVFEALQPQNQMVMMELYQAYAEKERAEQERRPEVLRDKPAEGETGKDS